MRYLKVVIIVVMFAFAGTAMAGTALYETGTLKSVDVESNTFTVELDKSGVTRTYNFPDAINFIDNGVTLVDKSAFKPGQPVQLKFESDKPKFTVPGQRTKKEYTLKGMTVK
jgi:hypothetical protein